jgi:hypothetical protein
VLFLIDESLVAWFNQLKVDATLTQVVDLGSRFAPFSEAQNTDYPAIFYKLTTGDSIKILNAGPTQLMRDEFQFDCVAESSYVSKFLAQYFYNIPTGATTPQLDGFQGVLGPHYIQGIHLQNHSEIYEEPRDASELGIYRHIIEMVIWWDKTRV